MDFINSSPVTGRAEAAMDLAKAELEKIGYSDAARRLQYFDSTMCGAGSWEMDFINSSPVTGISDAVILSYSGYSGTRHVVFFLHGLTGSKDDLMESYCKFWNYYPGAPWISVTEAASSCSYLTAAGFEHLVMVFPSSDILDDMSRLAWGDDAGDAVTFEEGIGNLEEMMCGFSNGGACAMYSNMMYGAYVTKAVAIDFHA